MRVELEYPPLKSPTMEAKKSQAADLENKRAYFTSFGFIITLVTMLIIFGWKTYDNNEIIIPPKLNDKGPIIEDIISTKQELPKPPPIQVVTAINLVDNKQIVEDIQVNAEIDEATKIEPGIPPKIEIPDEKPVTDEIILVPDVAPAFPGGLAEFYKYLYGKVKFTDLAKEVGISGTVIVAFVVEKDGSITDIRLLRGVGAGLDEQVIKAISEMPKWTPGWYHGRLVRASYNIPVTFKLKEM